MRSRFVAVTLVAPLLMALSPAAVAQETLTNQSVVEMVKAGLSERVIIAKIRTSPTNFDTRTDALIALKNNGVSEQVIEAIMSPSAPPAAAAAPPPPPSAPAGSVAMAPPRAAGPSRPTVFLVAGGKEVELMAASGEVQRNRTPYSRSTELVIGGNKAKYRTAERQPVFVITTELGEMPPAFTRTGVRTARGGLPRAALSVASCLAPRRAPGSRTEGSRAPRGRPGCRAGP